MNNRSKYLFKNIGILTISNFASKILVFLLVPLYTSILSTDEVGIYDLVVSTVSLLYPILTANIVDAVMRFSMDKANSKEEIISVAIRFIGVSWLVGGVTLLILRSLSIVPQIEGYEILIFAYFTFYILYQLLLQFSKGIERVSDMGIAGVISTVAMLGSNILFFVVFRFGLSGFFLANILAQVLPVIFLSIRLRFWSFIDFKKINKSLQREMLIYCIPLIATTIGWWVNSTSDKYVVAIMVGVGANGLLSVAYKIPQIINTLQGIFVQAWQISAIKEYGENDTAVFYGHTFSYVNLLMCAACSWLIILTKPIGHLLYQKDFFFAWQYVPFLLVSCVLNSASSFLGPILAAKKDSKSMALSAVYGASVNVVLNIILVYLIGVQGATIATVISSFIIYCVRKTAVGKEMRVEGYNIILFTWLLLGCQAFFEIYSSSWWVELLLMIAMAVLNWNGIKQIVNIGKSNMHRRVNK